MSLKHQLQGTALGLFIATSAFSAVYLFDNSQETSNENEISIEEAVSTLEEENFSVVTDDELQQLYGEIDQLQLLLEEEYKENVENSVDEEATEEDEIEEDEIEEEEEEIEEEQQVVEEAVQEFTLTIESGMHSRDIGEQLANYGIVDDARDFEQYVLELGIDRYLRIGEYEMTNDMTVDEVIDTITNL